MKPASEPSTVDKEEPAPSVSILQTIGSIMASFYGVQSSKNRKRDFQSGKAGTFIAVGVFMTAIWCVAISLVVMLVMHLAK